MLTHKNQELYVISRAKKDYEDQLIELAMKYEITVDSLKRIVFKMHFDETGERLFKL